jgi:phospholipase C
MKSAITAGLFGLLVATAVAQSQPGQFQHVLIVVQENRTPDNLFAGVMPQNGWTGPWFESGVDLAIAPQAPANQGGQSGQQWCLGACFDPGHENSAWQNQEASGLPGQTKNPGQCGSRSATTSCNNQPVCSYWNNNWAGCGGTNPITSPAWPEESYVSYTYDQVCNGTCQSPLAPYVQLATSYGFANYFYQTSQGPSEPAHDFLFGGTSAPSGTLGQGNYNYFDADNPSTSPVGCESTEQLALINPDQNFGDMPYQAVNANPCFEHLTPSDLLETNHLTWKYYTPSPNGIWTAPNAIGHICTPLQNGHCNNSDYTNNVLSPSTFFQDFDIGGTNLVSPPGQQGTTKYCALPSVAWIVPDGASSDHPGFDSKDTESTAIEGGPNWVASIVNAVGTAQCVEPSGPWRGYSPWNDTAILVVWDDWGGWYDHVVDEGLPDNYFANGVNTHCQPIYLYNGNKYPWGCGYTYGFRLPFLVVSAYTLPGTVSGSCTYEGTCVGNGGTGTANAPPHQHDLGSILAFVEYNFGLGIGCINLSGTSLDGIPCNNNGPGGPPGNFPFADYYAPDAQAGNIPLADFFNSQPPLGFTAIPLVNNSFTFDYFYNFNGPYSDPDNDMIVND